MPAVLRKKNSVVSWDAVGSSPVGPRWLEWGPSGLLYRGRQLAASNGPLSSLLGSRGPATVFLDLFQLAFQSDDMFNGEDKGDPGSRPVELALVLDGI